MMKLFPASCGGPQYLRALRGPFPAIPLVPTGGVRIDEISAYFDAGATVVALGSELVGRAAPRTDADLEWIASQAARATAVAHEAAVVGAAG
jgi:2-dehydro-3-deoxyphosphogluconate aldolase / (4S)-4-hydroxy-2-oxoglutarate aldolase